MEGERRIRWRALLKHLRGNAPIRMPKGWARNAVPLLEKVGLDSFRDRIASWFAPFRSGQALPLSVAGSHVLKGLIWYCAVAGDEHLKGCALWLLEVKWRQKRNTQKSTLALTNIGVTKKDLHAQNLIKERVRDPMEQLLEKLKSSLCTLPDLRIVADLEEDLVIVQGQMQFYRIRRSNARIERVSDNAVLELNWQLLPDQFRLVLNRQSSSEIQVRMRAFMLMHDGVFAEYFTEQPGSGAFLKRELLPNNEQSGSCGRGRGANTTTFQRDGDEGGDNGVWMSVRVDDVDEMHKHCVTAGLEVTFPPTNVPRVQPTRKGKFRPRFQGSLH